jgi:hypothetical protein
MRRTVALSRVERRDQRLGAWIVGAMRGRRRKVQDRLREPGQSPQATRRIEIADNRRKALRPQLCGTLLTRGQRNDARLRGMREQALGATQPHIAASDDEHAWPAQDSCRFHVRAL